MGKEQKLGLTSEAKELQRQSELLRNAFEYLLSPSYREEREITETEARRRYDAVQGLKTTDYDATLDSLCDSKSGEFLPDYAFLSETHLGLNVTLSGVILALQNPLQFGKQVQRMSEGRGVSDRSGKR